MRHAGHRETFADAGLAGFAIAEEIRARTEQAEVVQGLNDRRSFGAGRGIGGGGDPREGIVKVYDLGSRLMHLVADRDCAPAVPDRRGDERDFAHLFHIIVVH